MLRGATLAGVADAALDEALELDSDPSVDGAIAAMMVGSALKI